MSLTPSSSGSSSGAGSAIAAAATTLPGAPTNGQVALLTDSLTAPTYEWLMQYDTSIAGAYKWRFLGGAPLYAFLATSTATASGTYVTLDGGAPAVTLPGVGVYDISHGMKCLNTGQSIYGLQNVQTNGAVPGDDNEATHASGGATAAAGANLQMSVAMTFRRTVASIATSAVCVCVYRTGGVSTTFSNRWLTVRPALLG